MVPASFIRGIDDPQRPNRYEPPNFDLLWSAFDTVFD